MVRTFRTKPIVLEAIEFTGDNDFELYSWSRGKVVVSPVLEPTPDNPTGNYFQVETLEGVMTGIVGDYIIRGIKNEFYPCKADIFDATYDPVEE